MRVCGKVVNTEGVWQTTEVLCLAVSAIRPVKGSGSACAPGSLGNLLYPDGTQVRVSEDPWVALVTWPTPVHRGLMEPVTPD